MATFRSTFAPVKLRPGVVPAPIGEGASGNTELTTSGTAGLVQSGGSDFSAPGPGVVQCRSTGDVWLSFGDAPTAAVGTDFFLAADCTAEYWVDNGCKLSVIDDS